MEPLGYRFAISVSLAGLVLCCLLFISTDTVTLNNALPTPANIDNSLDEAVIHNSLDEAVFVAFDNESIREYYTESEYMTYPVIPTTKDKCKELFPGAEFPCCLGSYSTGGGSKYWPRVCTTAETNTGFLEVPLRGGLTYDWKSMVDVFQELRNASVGSRIAFIGDSVMKQVHSAFVCNLLRNATGAVREYTSKLISTEPVSESWRLGVKTKHVYNITLMDNHRVSMNAFRVYRPDLESEAGVQEILDIVQSNDVVLVNFGVHWLQREEVSYADTLRTLFQLLFKELLESTKETVLIWRETHAEHFHSAGGEYPATYNPVFNLSQEAFKNVSGTCRTQTLFTEDHGPMRRDKIAYRVAVETGFQVVLLNSSLDTGLPVNTTSPSLGVPVLYWFPLWQYTSDHAGSLQIFGRGCNTHICYTPIFWAPVIENLYNIIKLFKNTLDSV